MYFCFSVVPAVEHQCGSLFIFLHFRDLRASCDLPSVYVYTYVCLMCACLYVCTYVPVRMYVCTYVRMYKCTYVCMCVCDLCMYVMYVCMYVRMCVYVCM